MIIRFKKLHPDAVTPKYSREGDAAVDLTAVSWNITDDGTFEYRTGLAIEVPKGCVGLVYPRSSLSNYDLMLANHVAVIDSNFRGEIVLKYKTRGLHSKKIYKDGDRIAQLIIQPIPEMSFIEVETLTDTNRGTSGFGSSGN